MKRTFEYMGETLVLRLSAYGNGNLAVEAVAADGEPVATLSVNMPPYEPLPEGVFFLKTWSENERIAAAFLASGLVERVDLPTRASGFITANAYRFA
ncbi:MAG TPA: hypothetical protein VFV84_12275 [Burkholderiales bacterium]|nr:hypothetical protein [Burkholderiales bacterium]